MANAFETQLLDIIKFTDFMASFADTNRQLVDVEPYAYTVDGNALAANITSIAPQTFTTQLDGDADFVMWACSGFGRFLGSTNLIPNPAIMVQIAIANTGRTFFAAPVPMPFIAGQGGFPHVFLGPRVIRARSALKTTATAAQPGVSFSGFYMTWHGARLWYG